MGGGADECHEIENAPVFSPLLVSLSIRGNNAQFFHRFINRIAKRPGNQGFLGHFAESKRLRDDASVA